MHYMYILCQGRGSPSIYTYYIYSILFFLSEFLFTFDIVHLYLLYLLYPVFFLQNSFLYLTLSIYTYFMYWSCFFYIIRFYFWHCPSILTLCFVSCFFLQEFLFIFDIVHQYFLYVLYPVFFCQNFLFIFEIVHLYLLYLLYPVFFYQNSFYIR